MANLRKEARGRECQVRIYGVCREWLLQLRITGANHNG